MRLTRAVPLLFALGVSTSAGFLPRLPFTQALTLQQPSSSYEGACETNSADSVSGAMASCSRPLKASPKSPTRDIKETSADTNLASMLPTILGNPLTKIDKGTGLHDASGEATSLSAEMGSDAGTVLYVVRRPG